MRVGAPRAVADLLVTAVPELRDRLAEHHVRRAWTALVGTDVARRAPPKGLADRAPSGVGGKSPWRPTVTLRGDEAHAGPHDPVPPLPPLRVALGEIQAGGHPAAA